MFATHDERGLECWNQMVWKLDEVTGRGASAGSLGQLSLFDEPFVQPLRTQLEQLGPGEVPFSRLMSLGTRAGFKPTHVRKTLTVMAQDGLAFRAEPLDSRTPWPDDCVVRLYAADDLAEG